MAIKERIETQAIQKRKFNVIGDFMKEKNTACWEKLRAKGKTHFILVWGGCAFGLSLALLGSIRNYASFHQVKILNLLLNIVICFIGGLAWGYFMWYLSEDAYQQYLKVKK